MTNQIEITYTGKSSIEGTWYRGSVGTAPFEVLVFDQADEDYNYNGGRVSTVVIGKPNSVDYTAFSRGFYDGDAPTGDLKAKLETVANHFNA